MHFPSEKFDTYLDMLVTSMNSVLDYIELRFGYLMLKHIEGNVLKGKKAGKNHYRNFILLMLWLLMQLVNSTFYFLRCGAKNSIANNEAGSEDKGHVLSPLLWIVEPHDQCGSDIDFIKFKYDT